MTEAWSVGELPHLHHLSLKEPFKIIDISGKELTGRFKCEQSYETVFNSYPLDLHIASNFFG